MGAGVSVPERGRGCIPVASRRYETLEVGSRPREGKGMHLTSGIAHTTEGSFRPREG